MLKTTEDKDHHTQEHGQIPPHFLGIAIVVFHRNINQDIAENGQDKKAQRIIHQFDGTQIHSLFGQGCPIAGGYQQPGCRPCSAQISQPDWNQLPSISQVVFWKITHFSGKQGKLEGAASKVIEIVIKKYKKGCSVKETADMLEEPVSRIRQIYDVIEKNAPDYDAETIYKQLHEKEE